MTDRPPLYIPVSRVVGGDLTKKRTTNARNQPIPEDKQQFEIHLALRKDSPEAGQFFQQLLTGAKQVHAANPQAGALIDQWTQNGMQGFSMKVGDGDKPAQRTGKVNPNTAGCWVIYLGSLFPITCSDQNNIQIDPNTIKRGWYVDCTATLANNGQAAGDGIGIFINPGLVRYQGVGEEITVGPSIEQMAASMPTAPALPPGAQPAGSAPIASTPPPTAAMQGQPMGQPMQQQPMQQQPMQQQPMQQQPMQQPMQQQPMQQQPMQAGMPQQGMVPNGQPMQQPPVQQPTVGAPAQPAANAMPPGTPVGGAPQQPTGQPMATTSPGSTPPYGGYMPQ